METKTKEGVKVNPVVTSDTIVTQFRKLRLSGMAVAYEKQTTSLSAAGPVPFNERIGELLSAETQKRYSSKVTKLLKAADLPYITACPEKVDRHENRSLNLDLFVSAAEGKFIEDKRYISFEGATGSGKTYLACALGNAACRRGFKVSYLHMETLLKQLRNARQNGQIMEAVQKITSNNLIIVDEWLKQPVNTADTANLDLLIQISHGICSFIFCSQFMNSEWYSRLDCERPAGQDSVMADAIMDRIKNNMDVFEISSKVSMRAIYNATGERKIAEQKG